MKKASERRPPETATSRYDWSRAQRGRHAARFPREAHAVVIDPAVYAEYGSADAINAALALLLRIKLSLSHLQGSRLGVVRKETSLPAKRLLSRRHRFW